MEKENREEPDRENTDVQEERNRKDEEIREMGTLSLQNGAKKRGIQLLTIIGEIEGHEAVSGNTKATKCGGGGG